MDKTILVTFGAGASRTDDTVAALAFGNTRKAIMSHNLLIENPEKYVLVPEYKELSNGRLELFNIAIVDKALYMSKTNE